MLLKESIDLSLIVKKIIWGYPLTRRQMIILMFYDVDFLMKTVDIVLKQSKYNQIHQPGYFEEARHHVAIVIEYIGAPMQMVLPKCETALKDYDTAAFAEIYRFPQDSVKLQKLIDQVRRYTDRNHADEDKWSPELKAYIVAQSVGPMGIDNEALRTFHFHERRFSNATPGQPMPPFPPFKAESATYCTHCQSKVHDSGGCIVRLLHMCKQIGLKLSNRCSFVPDWNDSFGNRCMDIRPHVGPLLAQYEPSSSETYRERMVDTMLARMSVWERTIFQITLQGIVTTLL